MSHWRDDPLTGWRVRIAPARADRPNDYTKPGGGRCPFCAGAESETPEELERVAGPEGWIARAIPNRFPAVEGREGAQEVLIESPRHTSRFVDLTPDEATAAVTLWARRLEHWRVDDRFRYRILFKNEGPEAGASLLHVHSQLLALPESPPATPPAARFDGPDELSIVRESGLHVFCPATPRLAYQMAIVAEDPGTPFGRFADDQGHAAAMARLLRRLLVALDHASGINSYNLLIHVPTGDGELAPWRVEIAPRSAVIAGFELGTGLWINSAPPELVAQQIRDGLEAPPT